jgi:hypothetical protein
MLNICHRQQCKLYVQIFETHYIPNNTPSCHALDVNAALEQNNLYLNINQLDALNFIMSLFHNVIIVIHNNHTRKIHT